MTICLFIQVFHVDLYNFFVDGWMVGFFFHLCRSKMIYTTNIQFDVWPMRAVYECGAYFFLFGCKPKTLSFLIDTFLFLTYKIVVVNEFEASI